MSIAVIYARYSSDLQREASIEDQVRLCRTRIESEDWHHGSTYSDHGISGATAFRPGYQQLLQDARAGLFDIVLAEGLDRLSRDQEDVAALFKHLTFAGVRLITLAEGEISELHVGLKGTMNALYLKDLAQKTRRGLEGRVRQGRSGGGLCYGYRVVRTLAANGEPETGLREIDEEQAAVVRRIFQDFSAGMSPRAIAKALNEEGIVGPSGRSWQDTSIRGHAKRGTGILNNELYVGRIVWNRQRYMKDPSTGRRVARPNSPDAVVVEHVPELRIVDDALWQAVKLRQEIIARQAAQAGQTGNRLNGAHRRQYLLSGLLTCGLCGGAYTIRGKDRYACASHANRGTCDNARTVKRQTIESRVIAGLKHRLLAPDLIEHFIAEYVKAANTAGRDKDHAWAASRRELEDVKSRTASLLNAIEQGIVTQTTKERLLALEARKDELEAMSPPAPAPRLHPGLAHVYRHQIAHLEAALNDPALHRQAGEALRGLIEKIVLTPGTKRGEVNVELYGELGAIMALVEAGIKNRTPGDALAAGVRLSVVAGAGFGFCDLVHQIEQVSIGRE